MRLGLSHRQVQKPITELNQTKVDKTDYVWVDLGMVAYGIRNDEVIIMNVYRCAKSHALGVPSDTHGRRFAAHASLMLTLH